MNQAILTFNAGEISPYLRNRVDFSKLPAGAEEMRNFLPSIFGAALKRPGLEWIAATETAGANSAAFPFIASTGDRYILHFTETLLTIYGEDGSTKDQLDFLPDHTFADPTDYLTNLRAVQLVQLNDVAFITHPATFPLRLSRTSDTSWTLEHIPFTAAPVLDENTDPDSVMSVLSEPAEDAWLTSTAYVASPVASIVERDLTEWICIKDHTSSGANTPGISGSAAFWKRRVFDAGHPIRVILSGDSAPTFPAAIPTESPGIHYRVTMPRAIDDVRTSLQAIIANDLTLSTPIVVRGPWNVFTYGTWYGTFSVFRYADPIGLTDAETIRAYTAQGDRNIADSGTEDELVALALRYEKAASTQASGDQGAYIIPESIYVTGDILITAIDAGDDTLATGTTQTAFLSGFTYRYAPGAFSQLTGYPRAVAMHDGRLWFAGTAANPVSIWASQADDYLNFTTGTDAADAIFASLALSNSSPIRWLASQRRLYVGTAFGEWVIGSETSEAPVSPLNFMARQYSAFGSMPIQPLIANDAVFFAERAGGRLRELSYDASRESYGAADLSRLGEHLTAPGISGFAWQSTRNPGLWLVRRDGALLHFAYSRQEDFAAWSQHSTTGGLFRDVVVFPSDSGDDTVFFIVDRGTASALERFPAGWQAAAEADSGWFHLDGIQATGTSIAIPAHLIGTAVQLVTNDNAEEIVISASPLTFATSTAVQVGLPIDSRLIGLPIDVSAQDGTTQARLKRPAKITLSLYNSQGGQLWNLAESRAQSIRYPACTGTALFTGWADVIPDAGHGDDLQLKITHTGHTPFCLRSATILWNLTGER